LKLLDRPPHGQKTIPFELGEGGLGRRNPRTDEAVERRRPEDLTVAPKDLAQPAPDPVANDGSPQTPGHGHSEAHGSGNRSRQQKQLEMAPGHADPGGVALFEFPSLPKAVAAGEDLPPGRAWIHTESLLRPLRRRADRTARPERVRIRTRNPCVRLRRRLLG